MQSTSTPDAFHARSQSHSPNPPRLDRPIAARAAGRLIAALLLCGLGVFATAQSVFAENTIEVTTTAPQIVDDGLCSLAEAIENANTGAQVHDDCAPGGATNTIQLQSGALYTYTFTAPHNNTQGGNALPVITGVIRIEGNGATLTRDLTPPAPELRFFYVSATGSLTLAQLGLTNGNPIEGQTFVILRDGGAIYTDGALDLQVVSFRDNAAFAGGAIYASPTAQVNAIYSHFFNNRAGQDGGAIASSAPTQITDSLFYNNAADREGGALSLGGGTAPTASILGTVLRSEFVDNTARDGGGAIAAHAALSQTVQLTITHSLIQSNTLAGAQGLGGGILNATHTASVPNNEENNQAPDDNNGDNGDNGDPDNGNGDNGNPDIGDGDNTDPANGDGDQDADGAGLQIAASFNNGVPHVQLWIIESTLRANSAPNGGGIANRLHADTPNGAAELWVLRSLLAHNQASSQSAGGNGGGIYNVNGLVRLANSTLSGNRAQGPDLAQNGTGGALANFATDHAATVEIVNTSLVSNTASLAGGALSNYRTAPNVATIGVGNSLLVFNTATTPNTSTCSSDTTFGIFSQGHNLESTNSCQFNQASDILNANPRVRALANNGGPTQTHALRAGSPAIGRGDIAVCNADPIDQLDQRGVLRFNTRCDIGAFEFVAGKKMVPSVAMNQDN